MTYVEVDRQKLLIVDDEPMLRDLVQTVMEDAGYETAAASNGRTALAALDSYACDLVLTDLRMPELDGLGLLSALRARSDEGASPPLGTVLLTGCNDMALAIQAMKLGALNYLVKPFKAELLVDSVRSAIEQSREMKSHWLATQELQRLVHQQRAHLEILNRRLSNQNVPSASVSRQRPASGGSSVSAPDAGRLQASNQRKTLSGAAGEGDAQTSVATFEIPVQVRFPDTPAPVGGTICRVNTRFFVLSSPMRSDRGTQLEVLYRGRSISAQVCYCNRDDDGRFRLGLAMQPGEDEPLRREKRIPVRLAASMSVAGRKAQVPITVIDISPSGLGIVALEAVDVGELACVDLGSGLAFGEIRHCTKRSEEYRMGLQIEECIVCDAGQAPALSKYPQIARGLLGARKKSL